MNLSKSNRISLERTARARILVVDEDDLARDTFAAMLEEEGYAVCCAASAHEALACCRRDAFDLLLAEVCMMLSAGFLPGQNSLSPLAAARNAYPEMPILLIADCENVAPAREALKLGAADFIVSPCSADELLLLVERALTRQAAQRKSAQQRRQALLNSNETVLDALLTALNTRDTETEGHVERVTAYTIEIADRLGLSDTEMTSIERGALLHDIGKIGVPDSILRKPGPLTAEEWAEIRKHPLVGYEMCAQIDLLKLAAQIVLHHHEAWNGGGYPHGLQGRAIPLGARIFAVADTLDAMTSIRPYRPALPFEAARAEIQQCSGKQFDPAIVQVFLSLPEERWQRVRSQTE